MRRAVLTLTVTLLAPTAVMALPGRGELVGVSELGAASAAIEDGVAATGERGACEGNVILAKGDKSGTGGGHGGHKGEKKGGHHGKQKEGEHNKS